MFDLEKSIKDWLKQFQRHRAYDDATLIEMELHLRDHIDDLVADGYDQKEAFEKARKSFGKVQPVAREEFYTIKRKPSIKSMLYMTMINNYFKTSTRGMMKNPLTTFINIFGISVAIGVCLVVYSFMDFDLSIDRYHENSDKIFVTTFYVDRDGTEEQYGYSPLPLAEAMKTDLPVIKNTCRVEDRSLIMKYKDNVFHESIRFVDPEFLEMFTFPLKLGSKSTLSDVNSVIISEEMAIKYFGDQDPVGKSIIMIYNEGHNKSYTVSGVAEPFQKTRIIDFDFLVNFKNLVQIDPEYNGNDWRKMVDATLIQVEDPDQISTVQNSMEKYKKIQNEVEHDWTISSFDFVSIWDLHLASGAIRNDISYDGSLEGRVVLPVVALFMIILACFNYINMAIVSVAKRLKEIGLRKVLGASKKKVIFQFLTENIFTTFFAGIIGICLAFTIFLPWFRDITGRSLELSLLDFDLLLFLVTILLFTGIVSGIYPAFYISKFSINQIFKGSVRFGRKNMVTKVFLVIQLIVSCIGITGAVMFSQNSEYQAQRDWGYNPNIVLYAEIPNNSSFQEIKHELLQNPTIESVSGSRHHLGKSKTNTVIQLPDRKYEIQEISVDADYLETMGMQMIKGRFFHQNQESDHRAVVITAFMAENLSWKDPIGKLLKIDSLPHEVIGVVENFHFYNFYYPTRPTMFTLADEDQFNYLSMRVKPGTESRSYETLKGIWTAQNPELPFQGGFQEDVWTGFYEDLETQKVFTKAIAIILVILAALGLYGLITYNITGRIREFSIRKVLGASVKDLANSISRQYLILFLLAIVASAPISHILIKATIDMMYPDPRPFGYSGVIIAEVILILVLSLVIISQVRKVSRSNPVEGLKVEA